MSEQPYSVFNAMTDIVAAPGKALDEVKNHTAWLWWPLLINVGLAVAATVYYAYWVDMEWLIDDTIANLPPGTDPAAADGVRSFMGSSKTAIFGSVAIVVITFVIYALQALWLHLVNKVAADEDFTFGQWFSFSAWTGFIGVINTLVMLGVIFSADNNQLAQADLVPLSINALIIHAAPSEPWFTWGSSLTLIHIWMLVLMSIGVARWTGASMIKAALIACTPWVALFGIWALLIG
jgi:hypothetical protein